ncbi:MAG: CPBP family intramembrane metalloprotease [Anaerolineae bacterium]|nr:CPBP family intramembrane metalloprotease [Anaerolineae bacterium]
MLADRLFERARAKSWGFLLLIILVSAGMSLLSNLVFFRYGTFAPVYEATNGLLNSTLIASGLHLLVILGLLVFLGRMRGPEFGVVARHIGPGVFALVLLWVAMNLVLLLAALLAGQGVTWHPGWADRGVLAVLGSLIGQVFGNALAEEIQYRGFLLPQFWHKLRALAGRPWLRVVLAVTIMAAIFSVSHIPNRMFRGQPFDDWAFLIGMGAWFAVIYLRTGNLFVAVAVHALQNAPTLLFASPLDYGPVIIALGVLLVIIWPQVARLYGQLFREPAAA